LIQRKGDHPREGLDSKAPKIDGWMINVEATRLNGQVNSCKNFLASMEFGRALGGITTESTFPGIEVGKLI
jgi:hypothetical protein